MSGRYRVDEPRNRVLQVELSPRGRALSAGWTAFAALAVSLGIMVVLFGPDFLLDTDAREADGYSSFFAGFVLIAAGVVAAIAGIMRALARTRWTFDGKRGQISVWIRTTMGHQYEETMGEDALDDVLVRDRSSFWAAHQLLLAMSGGDEIVVAQTRGSREELDGIAERIHDALDLEAAALDRAEDGGS